MYYNVAQLLKEPVGSTRTYTVDDAIPTEDSAEPPHAFGQVSLMRTDKGIWAAARLDVRESAGCSRCLKKASQTMGIVFDEEYFPTVEVGTGQTLGLPEGAEGSFIIDPRHGLDLAEALRQYLLTNRIMKPLCREDCRGLCPTCGADRNEVLCGCDEAAVAPGWAPLLRLAQGHGR